MKVDKNARIVLEKRYLIKDENLNPIETVEGLFMRVATAVSAADLNYDKKADVKATANEFYEMMTNLEFLPNSPTLMNAGRPLGQLSACFVLPVEDSMESIFETIKQAAMIHKSGGGTGFSFSRIRPKGATVNSTGGVASGPISFMKVFNSATEAVKQGGTRRGANMGILRIDHPDILEFISCKADNADITNFNISVGITENFMQCVVKNKNYNLIDPHDNSVVGTLNAKKVFDKVVECAWKNGEPGIIFLDRLNKDNVVPQIAQFEATNPCGEQPLLPYESCNLGSINVVEVLDNHDGKYSINFDKLANIVSKAVHFLDNVIDINKYPLDIIGETTKKTRKIGLGLMGFADMLYLLGVPYNSQQGVDVAKSVMKCIHETAKSESCKLGKIRGTFPQYEQSIYKDSGLTLRNATITTIAPTGTLSIVAGVSGGIEPTFALAYIRNVMDGTELVEINPIFKEYAQKHGFYSEELMRKIAQVGTVAYVDGVPQHVRDIFVTAHEVSPEWHIKMQAAFQEYTDNAVSKTVNFCKEATVEQVAESFLLAYEQGCKGVTIYRDGSRDAQVLNIGKVKKADDASQEPSTPQLVKPRPRPDVTMGYTEKIKIGCGNLYVTVNYDENGVCEVFTNTGKAGGCPSQSEATSRLVSIALRSGMDGAAIIEQLKGIRCPSTIRQQGMKVLSCPDAIGRVVEKVIKMQNGFSKDDSAPTLVAPQPAMIEATSKEFNFVSRPQQENYCPECGEQVEHEGGCVICKSCGYSKCG